MKYDYSLGYGTNYEKLMLKEYFDYLFKKYPGIRTVAEFPANNLLGNSTEMFEDYKDKKIVGAAYMQPLHIQPLQNQTFDLVWSFCEFEASPDPVEFLEKSFNLSKNKILIITQNYFNPGVIIHKLWHILGRYKWDHGNIPNMNAIAVKKYLNKYFKNKFKILQIGSFDLPWFVLDVYESAAVIKEKILRRKKPEEENFADTEMGQKVQKSFLEKHLPPFVKFLLSHVHYILLEKK